MNMMEMKMMIVVILIMKTQLSVKLNNKIINKKKIFNKFNKLITTLMNWILLNSINWLKRLELRKIVWNSSYLKKIITIIKKEKEDQIKMKLMIIFNGNWMLMKSFQSIKF